MTIDEIIYEFDKSFNDKKTKKPSDCIVKSNELELYVVDNEKENKCLFITKENKDFDKEKWLKIFNINQNEIALWAIDGCFIKDKTSRCDSAVFNYKKFAILNLK